MRSNEDPTQPKKKKSKEKVLVVVTQEMVTLLSFSCKNSAKKTREPQRGETICPGRKGKDMEMSEVTTRWELIKRESNTPSLKSCKQAVKYIKQSRV